MSVWCAMASQCSFQVRWPFHVWMWALFCSFFVCAHLTLVGYVCAQGLWHIYFFFFFVPFLTSPKSGFPATFYHHHWPSAVESLGRKCSTSTSAARGIRFFWCQLKKQGLSGWGGGEQLRYLSLSLPIRLSPSFDTLHCHPHGSRTSSFPSCLLPHCRCHSSSCPLFIFSFYNSVAAVLLANGPSVHFAPLPLVGFLPSLPSFSCTCGFHLYLSFHPG